MKILLPIKALSINAAFQGRRFKTLECKNYESEVWLSLLSLNPRPEKISGWVEIKYVFYLTKNFKICDVGNLEKLLTDVFVKFGLIDDDRFVKRLVLEKQKGEANKIEIEITKIQ